MGGVRGAGIFCFSRYIGRVRGGSRARPTALMTLSPTGGSSHYRMGLKPRAIAQNGRNVHVLAVFVHFFWPCAQKVVTLRPF